MITGSWLSRAEAGQGGGRQPACGGLSPVLAGSDYSPSGEGLERRVERLAPGAPGQGVKCSPPGCPEGKNMGFP